MTTPAPYHLKLVQIALDKLDEKGISSKCPACRHTELEGDIGAFSLSPLNYAASVVRGEVGLAAMMFPIAPVANVPMLALTCKNCGNTQLFNLRALGVMLA